MSVKQTRENHSLSIALIVLALLALLMGLTTAFGSHSASAHNSGPAYVRVLHAAPAAGNVDVFVDDTALLKNFAFGSITGYVKLDAGEYRIRVAPAGAGAEDAVIDEEVTVKSGAFYTAAALGGDAASFSLGVFQDNNEVDDSKASVRVYHLSPNAGPVKVAVGGNTVIPRLKYTHASKYLTVPAGSYTFDVTALVPGVTLKLPATFKAGYVYSVFAIGLYKGSPALQFVVAAYAE
ncbi:MAG: DUF4397 domain-containing protein [Ktedonobacteraceae bacterium]